MWGGARKKRPHLWRKSVNRRGWPRLPRRAWFGAAALKQWRAVPLPWLTPALGATAPRMPSQEAPTPTLTSTRPDALFSLVQVAPWKPKTKRWRGCPSDQASVTPAPARPWFLHENSFWFPKAAISFRCAASAVPASAPAPAPRTTGAKRPAAVPAAAQRKSARLGRSNT